MSTSSFERAATGKKLPTINSIIKDADLCLPLHDEILLWLDKHIELILGVGAHWIWDPVEVSALKEAMDAEVCQHIDRLQKVVSDSTERKSLTGSRALTDEAIAEARDEYTRTKSSYSPDSSHFEEGFGRYLRYMFLPDDVIHAKAEKHLSLLRKLKLGDAPRYPGCKVKDKIWQQPIFQTKYDRQGREVDGALVCYIDFVAVFRRPVLVCQSANLAFGEGHALGKSLRPKIKWNIGYTDLHTNYYDVRTAIPSLGTLLRDIDFIQQEIDDGVNYVVVSPDDKCEEVLSNQGINFLPYNADFAVQLKGQDQLHAETQPGNAVCDYMFEQIHNEHVSLLYDIDDDLDM